MGQRRLRRAAVQRGTGDAALVGHDRLPRRRPRRRRRRSSCCPGDTPLLRAETLARSSSRRTSPTATRRRCSPASLDDPTGYGRVVARQARRRTGAAHRRAARRHRRGARRSTRSNTSIYCFRRDLLGPALRRLRPDNAQGEYYLTDVVEVLAGDGPPRSARVQAPRRARRRASTTAGSWRSPSASCAAAPTGTGCSTASRCSIPRQTYIDVTVQLGRDVTLFPGTILQGSTVDRRRRRDRARHPPRRLRGRRAAASSSTRVGRDAEIGDDAHVGPFAHLPAGYVSRRRATVDRRRSTLHPAD